MRKKARVKNGRSSGHGEPEGRAAERAVADGDAAAVSLGDALRDREAETRAARCSPCFSLPVAIEDVGTLGRGDAGSAVADLEGDLAALRLDRHADAPAARGELERVGDEVVDGLA